MEINSNRNKEEMWNFMRQNLHLFTNISDEFKCCICNNVLINAQQSECSCSFCKECLFKYLEKSNECPGEGCTQYINVHENVVEDIRKNSQIKKLVIKCDTLNCDFEGTMEVVWEHIKECSSKYFHISTLGGSYNKVEQLNIQNRIYTLSVNHSKLIVYLLISFMLILTLSALIINIQNMKINHEELKQKFKNEIRKKEKFIQEIRKILNDSFVIKLLEYIKNEICLSPISFFVWRVDNIIQKREDAKHGKSKEYLFSDPFFTKKSGYKLRLVIYPNGLREGLNTHLRLSLQIMRSGHDEILVWPFTETVKFSLIDTRSKTAYASDTFSFKEHGETFREYYIQPTKEFNTGLGLDKFVSWIDLLDDTKNLIKDGSIYIKVDLEQ